MKKYFTLFSCFLFCFGFSLQTHAQIPNGGFENWTLDIDGNLNPDGWNTTNSSPLVNISQYTPAHSGNYSMQAVAFNPGFGMLAGVANIDFPCSQQPTQLSACVMTTVMPGDFVYIILAMRNGDSIVSAPLNCTFKIDSNITQFTCLTFPIVYQSPLAPDSASIIIAAGNYTSAQLGTSVIIDDLSFGFGAGIEEHAGNTTTLGQNFPNPTNRSTIFPLHLTQPDDVTITVYDVRGRVVHQVVSENLASGEQQIELPTDELPAGVYSCSFRGADFLLTRAFLVSR